MDKINVFISYSHDDDRWIKESNCNLIPWLEGALKNRNVVLWYDHNLEGGSKYKDEIKTEIENAHIAILLISQNFVISDFIRDHELPQIKARFDRGELSIIPIQVGPVDLERYMDYKWLTDVQIIPGKPTPLINYLKDIAAWEHVKVEILTAIENRIAKIQTNLPPPPNENSTHDAKLLLSAPASGGSSVHPKESRKTLFYIIFLTTVIVLIAAIITLPRCNRTSSNERLTLIITEPKDGIVVGPEYIIRGRVLDKTAAVWVVVHPALTEEYWVQDKATIDEDGQWSARVTIGRPGIIDTGKPFEIMAIAGPKKEIREGDIREEWPEGQWKSQLLKVTRN